MPRRRLAFRLLRLIMSHGDSWPSTKVRLTLERFSQNKLYIADIHRSLKSARSKPCRITNPTIFPPSNRTYFYTVRQEMAIMERNTSLVGLSILLEPHLSCYDHGPTPLSLGGNTAYDISVNAHKATP